MKPSLAKIAIETAIKADKPLFIWGSPGVGKSSIVREIAEAHHAKLFDVRALLLEPVDLRGLPHIENGVTKWSSPVFLPAEDEKEESILFLDELNAADQSTQAACYQLVLDRKVGEHKLPKNCRIIAAGNNANDRARVQKMPSALANRLIHIDLETDTNDWIAWGIKNGIKTEILAFIMFRPDLLFSFDPKTDARAFATPRSWETASRILDALPSGLSEDKAVLNAMLRGALGEGAATELTAFLEVFADLPSPHECLLNPEAARLPETPSGKYAICGSLSQFVTTQNAENFFKYVERMDKEFQTLSIKLATWKNPVLCNSRSFINWASANQNAFI